jgi:hypothetical protein
MKRVDGQVGLQRNLVGSDGSNSQWVDATPNAPVSVGDRIYARDNAHAAIAFTGRNFARLNPNTSLDVLSLSRRRTQLALRNGSAIFNVSQLAPGELFEVGTPYGAVDFDQPGLYEVGYDDSTGTIVRALSGLAQVVGLGGTGQVSKGEMLTLLGQTAADVTLSRINPSYASGLLNDYYGYMYPNAYDGRYGDYSTYLNDPYYYDPYNRYTSYRYVADVIPGVEDLDPYGDWLNVDNYGYVWRPRVDTDWAPYEQGYWTMDDPYGLTWVSNEPWGYAPYHYGRWAYVGNQWVWVPDRVNTVPAYSPALVAFVPLQQQNEVGWVPLGPGDPYTPVYYTPDWRPQYVAQPQVVQQVVNFNVPNAVTVVPVQQFRDVITPREIKRMDRQMLGDVRPVLDPLSVVALKQAALQPAVERRGFALPPGIAKKLADTPVITSTTPAAPPFKRDLAQEFKVQQVPEERRKEKLKFKDLRQEMAEQQQAQPGAAQQRSPGPVGQPNGPVDQQRQAQIAALATQAANGDKGARRQMRQLEQEQRRAQQDAARQQAVAQRAQQAQQQQQQQAAAAQAANERAQQTATERAQGEQVAQQIRAQRDAARQQAAAAQQQQRAVMQHQMETRRQAAEQAAAQRAQQAAAAQAQRQAARAQQQPQQAPARAQRQQAQPKPQVMRQAAPQPQPQRRQAPPAARPPQPQAAPQPQRQAPPQQHGGGPPPGKGGGGGGNGKEKGKGHG